LVDQRDGVVGEQGVGSSGQGKVVAQVAGGLLGGHGWHGVAQSDSLIQCCEGAKFYALPQGRLPDEQAGEGAVGVHVVVGQHADRLELGVIEQVCFVNDQQGGAAAFGLFGGQQVRGLGYQGGVVGQ
jgi:hypothetical protein